MTLQPIPPEFPYIRENLIFSSVCVLFICFFYQGCEPYSCFYPDPDQAFSKS
jgi:hypothetical protein